MIPELSKEENIKLMQKVLNVDEMQARFIYAMETGELDGDAVNSDGIDEFKGYSIENTAEEN